MADLFNTNNKLTIMRFEHQKQVALANITARTIRIMELEEEIIRMKNDIEAQNKVIAEQDKNIQIQAEQPQDDHSNVIPGVVETITFHGAITRLGVNVSGQRVVADVTVTNTKPVTLNQKIWLVFAPSACQVMGANE